MRAAGHGLAGHRLAGAGRRPDAGAGALAVPARRGTGPAQ